MQRLADFPITARWRPRNPDAIQLYAVASPNGVKASIMLEETGLAYDAHYIDFDRNEQYSPEFRSLNPNARSPAIIDPHGPGDVPLPLFESGAILLYLAEKSGQFLPGARRWEVIRWLMLLTAGLGPTCGQVEFFYHYAGREIEDPRPRERYRAEAERLFKVLDGALEGREWIAGEYSIADIAICPWLRKLRSISAAREAVGMDRLANVMAYLERFLERPAVQRGLLVPAKS